MGIFNFGLKRIIRTYFINNGIICTTTKFPHETVSISKNETIDILSITESESDLFVEFRWKEKEYYSKISVWDALSVICP